MLFKKKTIVLLVLLVSFFSLSAQYNKLLTSKVVYEGTENPVAGATVEIAVLSLVTTTDEKGVFSFKKEIPEGTHIISVKKDGFIPGEKLVEKVKGEKIDLVEIEIRLTKKEEGIRRKNEEKLAKQEEKRKKTEKSLIKKHKKNQIKIAKQKARDEEEKIRIAEAAKKAADDAEAARIKAETLAEEAKNRGKGNSTTTVAVAPEPEEDVVTENQAKYAGILGVDVTQVTHKKLYEFIDQWMGTPYLMGGETEKAIDCSSFSQRLFVDSYGSDMYIERTAQKQFDSEQTELFKDKVHLREGDLIFFGKDSFNITHVGVYLHNNKFVHATANTKEGPSGVKISDLTHPFWSRIYFSSGRRSRSAQ